MRKTLLLLTLASVSAFLVVACSGNSSTPIAPDPGEDLIAPSTPTNLSVQVQGNTVHLNWRENVESDLEGYRIYRTGNGPSLQTLSEVLSAGYYDRIESANPLILEYKVTAFDQSANESGFSTMVEVLYSPGNPDADGKDQMGNGY